MQTFQVTSPDICGLVINAGVDKVLAYLGNTTSKAFANDSDTFEEFTTLTDAATRAVEIQPDFDLNKIFSAITLVAESVSPSVVRPEIGTEISLSSVYTVSQSGTTTYTYKWYKSDRLKASGDTTYGVIPEDYLRINGANTGTITSDLFAATMRGTYRCDVEAINLTEGTIGRASTHISVLEPLPHLDASDAIGGTDPYGSINTGRGDLTSSGDPDDLNFTYVTLIDTTYTQSELELYVPGTNTTIPYVTSLPAPYHFDSIGACFNGTDYTLEIRLADDHTVLGRVTVPGPQTTNDEIFFWNPD